MTTINFIRKNNTLTYVGAPTFTNYIWEFLGMGELKDWGGLLGMLAKKRGGDELAEGARGLVISEFLAQEFSRFEAGMNKKWRIPKPSLEPLNRLLGVVG